MKNRSLKLLKKQSTTLVKYAGGSQPNGIDTTGGGDPTNTVITVLTTSGMLRGRVRS